jgi:hypothetical protein
LCEDNQDNKGGLRGGGHGGRVFGGGRGLVVCHKCQKLGHYEIDYPYPPTTCMYCRATDHEIEDCPTLLIKIQDKRNQNNQNVQWIWVEKREEDGKNNNKVTIGGAKTGEDASKKYQDQYQWTRKNIHPKQNFDACKEKDIFKEAKQ